MARAQRHSASYFFFSKRSLKPNGVIRMLSLFSISLLMQTRCFKSSLYPSTSEIKDDKIPVHSTKDTRKGKRQNWLKTKSFLNNNLLNQHFFLLSKQYTGICGWWWLVFGILSQINLLVLVKKALFPKVTTQMTNAFHYIFIVNKII